MDGENSGDAQWVAQSFASLRSAIGTVIIGQDEAVRLSFVTLLCSGHSLYEGVPGVAKTLLVRTLAATLGMRFGRIQCTPDLMPSDIIGTPVLHARWRVPLPAGAAVYRFAAGRRDQSRTGQNPGRATRGDAGTRGDGRRHAALSRRLVHGARNPESDRAGGHLSIAGGRAGPLPVQDSDWLSERGGGSAYRCNPSRECASAARPRRAARCRRACPRARNRRRYAGARGDSALRGVARARDARPSCRLRSAPRRARRSGRSAPRRRSPRSKGAALCCPRTCRPSSARRCAIAWSSSPARRSRGWVRTTQSMKSCERSPSRIDARAGIAGGWRAGAHGGPSRIAPRPARRADRALRAGGRCMAPAGRAGARVDRDSCRARAARLGSQPQ